MKQVRKTQKARWRQVLRNIPDIRNYKTMFYIGAKAIDAFPSGVQLVPDFKKAGYMIDVLEIWSPNIQQLRTMNKRKKLFRTILKGDVRQIYGKLKGIHYDVIVWWHGPEHVEYSEIPKVLKGLEQMASHLIVLGMPYARKPKKAFRNNPFEEHKCALRPTFFKKLGYETDHYGRAGHFPNNLLAWKRMNDVL